MHFINKSIVKRHKTNTILTKYIFPYWVRIGERSIIELRSCATHNTPNHKL